MSVYDRKLPLRTYIHYKALQGAVKWGAGDNYERLVRHNELAHVNSVQTVELGVGEQHYSPHDQYHITKR